jgi:hypothetical protein
MSAKPGISTLHLPSMAIVWCQTTSDLYRAFTKRVTWRSRCDGAWIQHLFANSHLQKFLCCDDALKTCSRVWYVQTARGSSRTAMQPAADCSAARDGQHTPGATLRRLTTPLAPCAAWGRVGTRQLKQEEGPGSQMCFSRKLCSSRACHSSP